MIAIRSILAPVDFSERSEAAAAHAARLARRFEAELTLLHVRPPETYPTVAPSDVKERDEAGRIEAQRNEAKLRALADEVWAGGRVHAVDAVGDPATRIIRRVESEDTDLIVMGTHGHGVFRRFLLGSVTQKVLHDTQVSLLTGAHLEEAETFSDGCERVLCAVGLKDREHSAKVLRAARDWADALGAELHVMHAPSPTEVAAWEGAPVESTVAIEKSRREELEKLLGELGIAAPMHVTSEDPPALLARLADELNADLVVTGRSVRKGVLHWPHGDAFAVIRESPAPVLSV